MKKSFVKPIAGGLVLVAALAVGALTASAQSTLTWDITPGAVGVGDSAITGGAGTWNTGNGNWTTDAGANNIAWINVGGTPKNDAIIGGTAGTVTLGEAISLRNLTINTPSYTITGNTLNFTSGTITVPNPPNNTPPGATIESNITGAPAVNATPMDGDEPFTFKPAASGSMILGNITGDGAGNGSNRIYFQGGAGSISSVGTVSGPKTFWSGSGTWTLTGTANGYAHEITGGTLIISTGTLRSNNRSVLLSGANTTLHYNNSAAVQDGVVTFNGGNHDFMINGGSIDQTKGSAITTSTYNPEMVWGGNWTFIGSNGAFSDLYLGNGRVALTATRQVTIQNAATTLAVGGVISGATFGLTKAGDGTLELRGINTYTGATTVNAGTLLIKSGGSLDASSAVTVNNTGTLGGNGTVNGSVTVANGGNLAPGALVGTLSIGNGLNISAMAAGTTGKLRFGLDALAGTSDKIAVTGGLTIGTGVLDFTDFDFTNLGGLEVGTYTLITTTTGITGTLDILANRSGLIGAFTGTLQINVNNLELVVSAGDTIAPTVRDVTSLKPNGTYKVGEPINVTVQFSEVVTVSGTPQLTLETGASDQIVNYTGGSGSDTLTFGYTVQAGDTSADLNYVDTTSLAFNGGTIQDAALNNAVLTLPAPVGAGSLGANKALVIDGIAPTVTSSDDGDADDTVQVNDTMTYTVTFSEAIDADTVGTGDFDNGAAVSPAGISVDSVSQTSANAFEVQVILTSTGNLQLRIPTGSVIADLIGNSLAVPVSVGDTITVNADTTPPRVVNVTSPKPDGTYMAGELINVTVQFSEVVTVSGTPQLTLETGASDQIVNYTGGSGSDTLTFEYTVQAGDTSADLSYVNTTSLAFNGGTIQDADLNNAVLTLPAPGDAGSLRANKDLVIAATYYWDTDGSNGGFGDTAGTWGTSDFWSSDSSGASGTANTPITINDGINFGTATLALGSTAAAVGVSGTVSVKSITFGSAQTTAVTLSGGTSITLGGTATITVDNTSDTISTPMGGGATSVTKAGDGILILGGASTYTGTTIVNAGQLRWGIADALLSGNLTINNGGTVNMNSYADTVGTVTLNYGGTIMAGGASPARLKTGAGGFITTGGTVNSWPGIGLGGDFTYNTAGGSETTAYIASVDFNGGNRTFTINNGVQAIDVDITTSIFSAGAGNYNITKDGAGTLRIGAAAFANYNLGTGTFAVNDGVVILNKTAGNNAVGGTGTVTIGDGTGVAGSAILQYAASDQIVNNAVTINSDGLWDLNGRNETTTGALTVNTGGQVTGGGGSLSVGGLAGTGGTISGGSGTVLLTLSLSANYSGAAVIQDGGGTVSLTKTGTGTQILSGNNNYSGVTTISVGTITISHANALGSTAGNTTIAATGSPSTGGILSVSGGITTAENITITGATEASGYNPVITGSGTLSGIITLSSLTGGVRFGGVTFSGTITQTVSTQPIAFQGATVNNAINNNGGGLAIYTSTTTLRGVSGSGIGSTDISQGGTLKLGVSDALNTTGNLTLNQASGATATFDLAGFDQTVNALVSAGTGANTERRVINSVAGTKTLTVGNGGGSNTFNGQINTGTGNIQLIKTGAGNQTLSASNSYTGGTTINAGTLTLGHATDTLANGSAVNVNGGTLALGIYSDTVGAVTLTSGSITGSGAGTLTGTGSAYDVRSGSVSAILGGGVALTKSTAGTVTLSGVNSYTGLTDVQAGTLLVNSPGSLHASSAVSVTGGALGGNGTIGGTVTVADAGSIAPGASAVGTLSIGGGLNVSAMANGGSGKLKFDLDDPLIAVNNDKIAVTGTLTIGTDYLGLSDFEFTKAAGFGVGTYKLITTTTGISGTLNSADSSAVSPDGLRHTLQINGSDLELVIVNSAAGTVYLIR
jgi:autotransporter-associated beta strand protein